MFGLGDSNKSKLEENMDEIKEMVDGDSSDQSQPDQNFQDSFGNSPQPKESVGTSEKQGSNSNQTKEPLKQEKQSENTEKRLQEEIEKFEEDKKQETGSSETIDRDLDKPPKTGFETKGNQSPESNKQRAQGRTDTDIPEPAKTRELDIPEVEKGPLFITRKKFETATRLIYEMRGLSNEIESTVQAMEQDIKRERDTEQQVQTILNEFEQDRKDVESIISPK